MTNTDNSQHTLQGDIVDTILQKMGGIRPMAQKLDISVSTVQGWKQRKVIPKDRVQSIDAYLKQHLDTSVAKILAENAINTPQSHEKTTPVRRSPIPKTSTTKSARVSSLSIWHMLGAMGAISIITAVAVAVSVPYWYPAVMGDTVDSAVDTTAPPVVPSVPLQYTDIQPFLQPLQSDIAAVNNRLSTYTAATEADMAQIQQTVQGMQHTADAISDLYRQTHTTAENMQADIAQIKNSADMRTLYAMQWRIMYGVIMTGGDYSTLLPTLTIPKTDATQQAWQVIQSHSSGVITHRQIRDMLYKNAFVIAPALAENAVTERTPLIDRIKAKITHVVFVVDTPSGSGTSENTALKTLYTALDDNQTAAIVDMLQPLHIPELQPTLNRIQDRANVLNALNTIWQHLPQRTNKGTDEGIQP